MLYFELFLSFLQIGLFSIGGGYAAIPLIQSQVVENHAWLTMAEFTDLVTIAEMTPGPIAVNSATFVGIRIAGLGGAIVATFACILPSLVIVSLLAFVYYRYKQLSGLQCVLASLRPAVVALIASAGLSMLQQRRLGGPRAVPRGVCRAALEEVQSHSGHGGLRRHSAGAGAYFPRNLGWMRKCPARRMQILPDTLRKAAKSDKIISKLPRRRHRHAANGTLGKD